MKISYPYTPKSNRYLSPGDFWAIPLSDGSYGCGRVLQLPPKQMPSGTRAFLAGLMDWHSNMPPTYEAIAGSTTLEQGAAHILAITKTGGAILECRALELDELEPWVFVSGNTIQRGFTPLRPWKREDAGKYPCFSYWGYDIISLYAHKHFLGYLPKNV